MDKPQTSPQQSIEDRAHLTTPESTPSAIPEIPDYVFAFAERVRVMFDSVKIKSHELTELYGMDMEAFKACMEDTVEEIAQNNDEYQSTIALLKKTRRQNGNEAPLVFKINDMRAKIKQIIVSEAGLPDEARFSAIEQAKTYVANLLTEKTPDDEANSTPAEMLELLGIVEIIDEKKFSRFPYDLMPDSVIDKWKTYLALVCAHKQTQMKVLETGDKESVVQADRARKYAHDSVTNDVHVILGLEGKSGWSKPDTRTLLGEMRDCEFPTVDSAINHAAKKRVHDSHLSMDVATALSNRLQP